MNINVDAIKDYFATQPVDKAWLFGSYARGEETADSDVDIMIRFLPENKIGMKFIRIINELEDRLERPVDLVEEKTLLPWLKPFVEKDKILIYERKN